MKTYKLKEYAEGYGSIGAVFILMMKVVYRRAVNVYTAYLRKTAKLQEDAILFSSTPEFSDNSKALSDYLVENGFTMKYKIYWLVVDAGKYKNMEYGDGRVIFIPRLTKILKELPFKAIRVMMTSKYVLSTHANRISKNNGIQGQKYIYLWHGCGYKDNDKHVIGDNIFDVCFVPGQLFVKTKARFWHTDESKFLPIGYPRYDWLLYPSEKAKAVYDIVKGSYVKTILWMPTFRNAKYGQYKEGSITQFPLMADMGSWEALDKECERHNIKLMLKLHPLQKMYDIDFGSFSNICIIPQDFFNQHQINMYEFIAFTDGLISDYSSIAVDYLIVGRPIAFTLDDYQQYKVNRGFVFDEPLDFMPGHHLYNLQDLLIFINDVAADTDPNKEKRLNMMQIGIHRSKCYCQEAAEIIGLKL